MARHLELKSLLLSDKVGHERSWHDVKDKKIINKSDSSARSSCRNYHCGVSPCIYLCRCFLAFGSSSESFILQLLSFVYITDLNVHK